MTAPFFDGSFPHEWQAEILPARPLILPTRHFVYPREAEEVEHGALEVLIRPTAQSMKGSGSPMKDEGQAMKGTGLPTKDTGLPMKGTGFSPYITPKEANRALAPDGHSEAKAKPVEPFLATCALGFRDPAVPTGLWSTPNPKEICAISGGYAYIIDTTAPERFTMIAYRPVLEVLPLPAHSLLLFIGHHAILAWGEDGQAWQSERLSSEGLTLAALDGSILHGLGWDMMTDKETPFALDLKTGLRIP